MMEQKVPKPRGRPRKRRRPEEENANEDPKLNSGSKRRVIEMRSVALVGRYVLKEFAGNGLFLGKIVSYDTGLYRVDYEDGDFEDLESSELRGLILDYKNFDDNLNRRKMKLDELVAKKSLERKNASDSNKKVGALENGVDGAETSTLSDLIDGLAVENDCELVDGDADSSSDSCEHARGRDFDVDANTNVAPPPEFPPSSGTVGVPEECVSHLFAVYGFLRSFSIRLFLSPFGLDDFVGSLNCSVRNTLLDSIHAALLRALRHHLEVLSSEGSELASKCLRCLDWSLLDGLTWPVYLVQYFTVMGYAKGSEWDGFYQAIWKREYFSLPVGNKLMILQILCDDALECSELRAEIDMREECEYGADPDALPIGPYEKIPKRVHPRYSKTSALRDKGAMEIIAGHQDLKSVYNSKSLGSSDTDVNMGIPDANVDSNSDECRLCGMEGTLLCCDGCPSAYHSRCIGVSKMHIPEGLWYCPECAINKIGPAVTLKTSLRGAEVFGSDVYGNVFLGTCNHLLVIKAGINSDSYLRYYSWKDIPKVLHLLSSSTQHTLLYLTICKAIIQYWNIPVNICVPDAMSERVGKLIDTKEGAELSTLSTLPLASDSRDISCNTGSERASRYSGNNGSNKIVYCQETSVKQADISGSQNYSTLSSPLPIQVHTPGSQNRGLTEGGGAPMNKSVSAAADPSYRTLQSSVDGSSLMELTTCTSGNGGSNCSEIANAMCPPAKMSCEAKGNHVDFGNKFCNSSSCCTYMGSAFRPQAYMNNYVLGDFAATAAAKLAVLLSEESQASEVSKSGSSRKVTSVSDNSLQEKAFSAVSSRFFWPSTEKKLVEIPRERCGWCYSCQASVSSRKGCMLNSAVSSATKTAKEIFIGLPPVKAMEGSLSSIAIYILYMEQSFLGLIGGPFLNSSYKNLWRKKVQEALTCSVLKFLLLEFEQNISPIALSVEWVKLLDDWLVESTVAQVSPCNVGPINRRGPGGKRHKKHSGTSENAADDCEDKSFTWWRGGRLSKDIFQRAVLPCSIVRKAAKQGLMRKVSGVGYGDGCEVPKRSRRLMWRVAVEKAKNASQLGLQVRYLDLHLRWNDLVRPEQNLQEAKGVETEASAFRNAVICDKKIVEGKIVYGVTFGDQKHLPSRVMKNIVGAETSEGGKEKYWMYDTRIPLYLIKEYEGKAGIVHVQSAKKPSIELSSLQRRQLKAARRNIFTYLVSKRDKMEGCSCASCQSEVLLRNAVKCSRCQGYCHDKCTSSSVLKNGKVECLSICRRCHHPESLDQKEFINNSKITSFLPWGRESDQTGMTTKGTLLKIPSQAGKPPAHVRSEDGSVRGRDKNVTFQKNCPESNQIVSSSGTETKKSKIYNLGVIWRKKNTDDSGRDFRHENVILRGGSDKQLKPICALCKEPYNCNLMYIHCENCNKWFHADIVGIEESRILDVIGFKCCKCRRIRGPKICPHMKPETQREVQMKENKKVRKQEKARGLLDSDVIICESNESKTTSPYAENEVLAVDDPVFHNVPKVEQTTEYNPDLEFEQNATAAGLKKLPVRRHMKREGDADSIGHPEPYAAPLPDNQPLPKEESSVPFAEWNASGNDMEKKLLLDYGSINYEDMAFEPQTYFSFNELLDDGPAHEPGNLPDDFNGSLYGGVPMTSVNSIDQAMHCLMCGHQEPDVDFVCEVCGLLIHSYCSPWDESSAPAGNWRCGHCREWC